MEKEIDVVLEDSYIVKGANMALMSMSKSLETISGKLPIDTKAVPEYQNALDALEKYRQAVIKEIRYIEREIDNQNA